MSNRFRDRQRILQIIVVLAGSLLLFKAAQLQLFDRTFQEKARATTIDKQILYPSRGLFYDRNEKLIVYNDPIYDLMVIYNQVDPDMDTSLFCTLLEIDRSTFVEQLEKDWSHPYYSQSVPFPFMKKIPPERFSDFQEHLHQFPGFFTQLRNIRGYNYPVASQVLGYISEVSQEEIDRSDQYVRGDYIGASGLERQYESDLRGNKGVKYVLRDNVGREVGSYDGGTLDSHAISGRDIQITLDIELQQYGEQLMRGKKGSIVALDPSSGEVLAMVSSPTYDPSLLTIQRNRGQAFSELREDSLKPLFNRSIMAKYPPGSIFKPMLALVSLHENIIRPSRGIRCPGFYYYNGVAYGCHEHPYPRDVTSAIQHSCNTYFFTIVREFIDQFGHTRPGKGLDLLADHLGDFGLGQKIGADLPNESKGFLPTSSYYDDLYDGKNRWRSSYIMSIGIGQGELELTTLQMANLATIFANRGTYYPPHLLKKVLHPTRRPTENFSTAHQVKIDSSAYDPVIDGLERSVAAGTGRLASIPGIRVCGKTGTSQNPHGEDHSVFFAFAPRENPQIALAVYVENAGWGSTYAAPIAGLMIEKFIRNSIHPSKKWIEERMLNADLIHEVNP